MLLRMTLMKRRENIFRKAGNSLYKIGDINLDYSHLARHSFSIDWMSVATTVHGA